MTSKSPVWISHRGVRVGTTVENTKESFAAAVRKGFKVLETDLRLTADHHIVLAHDDSFVRLSQDDRPIIKLTRAQIESITLLDGQKPYFLDDFLRDHSKLSWVFDMKTPSAQAAAGVLLRLAKEIIGLEEFFKRTSFVAWCKSDEDYLKENFPGAKIFAREWECWQAGLSFLYFGGFGACIQKGRVYSLAPEVHGKKLFTKAMVEKYRGRGGRVLAFLPRNEAEAKEALAAGFDEILSDGWIFK